jgi:uncharacterized membrane protein (UPF0182 family)
VAANDQVVMRPTLGEAIEALRDPQAQAVDQIQEDPDAAVEEVAGAADTQDAATPVESEETFDRSLLPEELATLSDDELAREALATLDRANRAQLELDRDTYEQEIDRLETILQALIGEGGATPAATPED